MKPIAFIDIDGVLNRECGAPHLTRREYIIEPLDPQSPRLPLWLDLADGERLHRLTEHFEVVWATTWQAKADKRIAWQIGAPRGLRHVAIERIDAIKATAVHRWLRENGSPPFIWLEDQTREVDGLNELTPDIEHDIIHVEDISIGLTDAHIERAIAFAQGLSHV